MLEPLEQLHRQFTMPTAKTINIFTALGIHHNEVLICRLIGFLLTPNPVYSIDTEPLRLFLSMLTPKHYCEADLSGAHIVLEEMIENDRRVDIVIYIANDVFPIEVKIRAGDQPNQLFDYHRHFAQTSRSFSRILYLTPNVHPPSALSVTSKDGTEQLDMQHDIRCLSFEQISEHWLARICTDDPIHRMLIDQFTEVILYMTAAERTKQTIYEELSLTDPDAFRIEGKVATVMALMALDQQDLWKHIRDRYLRQHLLYDKAQYELIEDSDGQEINDRFCLYAVVHKDSREKVAWICVETNLYIVCRREICIGMNGSDQYFWQYLNPQNNGKPFALRAVNTALSDDDCIDIRAYLAPPESP